MKKLLAIAMLLFVWGVGRGETNDFNYNVSLDLETNVRSCGDVHVQFGKRGSSFQSVEAEERIDLPGITGAMKFKAARNGGIRLQQSKNREFTVLVCKAVAAESREKANSVLDSIRVVKNNNSMEIVQDNTSRSVVYLIVYAPENADVEMSAENGEISIVGFNGKARAKTVNGPISILKVGGDIDVEAVNGPVSVAESSGKILAKAQNGPVSVELLGRDWQGEGLNASTENGPIHLELPEDYRTGVSVSFSSHSPVSCLSSQCDSRYKNVVGLDDEKIDLGSSRPAAVQLTTVNGPVTIENAGE